MPTPQQLGTLRLDSNFGYECMYMKTSRIYKISIPLVPVVVAGRVGTVGVGHDLVDDYFQFLVSCILVESPLHGLLIELLEALHRTVGHHDHRAHYLLLVLPDELQSQEEQQSVMLEYV